MALDVPGCAHGHVSCDRSFQKRVLHFEFAVPALQFTYPLLAGYVPHAQWLSGQFPPVIHHPEFERGIANTKLSRHLGNGQRVINHHPGGLILKLSSVTLHDTTVVALAPADARESREFGVSRTPRRFTQKLQISRRSHSARHDLMMR